MTHLESQALTEKKPDNPTPGNQEIRLTLQLRFCHLIYKPHKWKRRGPVPNKTGRGKGVCWPGPQPTGLKTGRVCCYLPQPSVAGQFILNILSYYKIQLSKFRWLSSRSLTRLEWAHSLGHFRTVRTQVSIPRSPANVDEQSGCHFSAGFHPPWPLSLMKPIFPLYSSGHFLLVCPQILLLPPQITVLEGTFPSALPLQTHSRPSPEGFAGVQIWPLSPPPKFKQWLRALLSVAHC